MNYKREVKVWYRGGVFLKREEGDTFSHQFFQVYDLYIYFTAKVVLYL